MINSNIYFLFFFIFIQIGNVFLEWSKELSNKNDDNYKEKLQSAIENLIIAKDSYKMIYGESEKVLEVKKLLARAYFENNQYNESE